MTGPEHYQMAEANLQDATKFHNEGDAVRADRYAGYAQVHATLALAAATALMRDEDGACYGAALSGWNRAAGE